jgi:biotin carboxylase
MGKGTRRMKVLVLGGGNDQITLVEELKRRGIWVGLIDYNEKPIAVPFADKHFQVSTLDPKAVESIARDIGADRVVAVCTDQPLLTAAKVSEDLGLFFPLTYQHALNLTNKKWMKDILAMANIPTANYRILQNFEISDIDTLKYPLIFKPVDSNSSKGVTKVEDSASVIDAYSIALKNSRSGEVICEEFIEGTEVSVDGFVVDGKAIELMVSVSEKLCGVRNDFPICRSIVPAEISLNATNKIELILQQIADTFELVNSPLLVQCIVHGDDVYVLELSGRTGGGSKHHLIHLVTGVDVVGAFLSTVFQEECRINTTLPDKSAYMMQYIYTSPGVFGALQGFDVLRRNNVIDQYFQYKSTGMRIVGCNNSGDRSAGVLLSGNTREELNKKLEILYCSAAIKDIYGNDLRIIIN